MIYLSAALVIVAFLAHDAFRRYLGRNQLEHGKQLHREIISLGESVAMLDDKVAGYPETALRLEKVEKWVNGEESKRNLARVRAR